MKITVITVAYNSDNTIKDTIESVLAQTYRDIEYIIIDGDSKDNTMDIVRSYADKIAKIVSEPDLGIYDAMNKGIDIATGDVIGFLNSDDFFTSSDILETVARTFNENNIDALYGDVHFVRPVDLNKSIRYYSSALFNPNFFRFGFMPAHPSFYVKKKCYDIYGVYSLDYKIASDFDLLIRFLKKNHLKCKYVKKDFVTMRVGGISTKNVKSRVILNKENILACKRNGIYTNVIFVSFKYLIKFFEFKL